MFYILTVVVICWNSEVHTKEGIFHYMWKSGFLKKISARKIILKCKKSSRFQVTHHPRWENIIKVLTKSQESTFTRCHNSKEITAQWFKWHFLLSTALSHVLSFYFYKDLERKGGDTVTLVFQVKKKKAKWFGKATLLLSMLLIL